MPMENIKQVVTGSIAFFGKHLFCLELPCPDAPPEVTEGPGALRIYGADTTR